MKENPKKGTWGTRQLIRLFTVVLAILIFWLLGFVVKDIKSIQGPDYSEIERKFVDQSLVEKEGQIREQIADTQRETENKLEQQRLVDKSSQNLQNTINQLLELQRLSIQKALPLSESEQNNLSSNLKHYFESQKNYLDLNRNITELTSRKIQLEEKRLQIVQQIDEQKKPAQKEYDELNQSHRLLLASYQLAILVPLLLAAGYLLVAKRASIYYPLFLALGGATLVKVTLVIHEYFPTRYFKYMFIAALLAVVARLLIYLIQTIASPKKEWLARQYREAYERFLCPICEFPIRTGPRKFLYWTRRTVHKVLPQGGTVDPERSYTCPACGTKVFEECPSCKKIRHSLLANCEHCGAVKEAE